MLSIKIQMEFIDARSKLWDDSPQNVLPTPLLISSALLSLSYCLGNVIVITEPIPTTQIRQAWPALSVGRSLSPTSCGDAGTQAVIAIGGGSGAVGCWAG